MHGAREKKNISIPLNQSECIFPRNSRVQMILCAMLHAAMHTVSFVHGKMHSDWLNGIEILEGRWQPGEKADLKRLFVSGTYMSRWSRKG
jgi:hypothetical protein